MTTGWRIDRDYINTGEYADMNRVGVAGTGDMGCDGESVGDDLLTAPVIRFRCLDDDGEVYYGGQLHDDEVDANQYAAWMFGMNDAGAVTIEVKRDGEWKVELG